MRSVTPEEQQRAARKAWGFWLDREWSHFATLTTDQKNARGRRARRAVSEDAIRGVFSTYHRSLESAAGQPVQYAYTVEGLSTGHTHIHAMLNCPSLTVRQIRRPWPLGFTHVRLYDPERAAAIYTVKEFGRADGGDGVECSDTLPKPLHSAGDDAELCADQAGEAAMLELVRGGESDEAPKGKPLGVVRVQSLEAVDLGAWGGFMARLILKLSGVAA